MRKKRKPNPLKFKYRLKPIPPGHYVASLIGGELLGGVMTFDIQIHGEHHATDAPSS